MKFLSIIIFVLFALGCTDYSGGAVEIAWVIRGTDQRAYSCNAETLGENKITNVKLSIISVTGEYNSRNICDLGVVDNCIFECDADAGSTLKGVTTFSIPPGEWNIGLIPMNSIGDEIPSSIVQSPHPVRVNIEEGTLSFLGVWQIVINLSY
jgi:hypothetical protein